MITTEGDGLVTTVILDRPPHNYISAEALGALSTAIRAAADRGARAVVLRTQGRNFCAGADIRSGDDPNQQGQLHIYDAAIELFELPVPVIAAVQGKAVGAGCGLALAADFRVCAPRTRFSANFARLGFHHGFGMTVTLPRVVGPQAALDLLLTGREVAGTEAIEIGLADRLAESEDDLVARAHAWAAEVAASAPLAVASIRQTLRGSIGADVAAALRRERTEQERLMLTNDFREGVAALTERRSPSFHGR